MMKKIVALFLTAVICLTAFSALAEISLKSSAPISDGHMKVSWTDDSDSGPYHVFFTYIDPDGSPQKTWYVGSTKSKSMTFDWLVPGRTYEIAVASDDLTVYDTREYDTGDVAYFEDGALTYKSFKPYISARSLSEGGEPKNAKQIQELSASKIKKAVTDGGTQYGFRFGMNFPTLKKSRYYDTLISIEAPNGFMDSYYMGNTEFKRYGDRSTGELWWYFLGSDFFKTMYEVREEIPRGNYVVTMYLNGDYACDISIRVD